MFTHNPTTRGRTINPRSTLQAADDDRQFRGVESIPVRTMTTPKHPERPYIYGSSSQKARQAIVTAYVKWMQSNPSAE